MADGISLGDVVQRYRADILDRWLASQDAARLRRLMSAEELRASAEDLLDRLSRVTVADASAPEFARVRDTVAEMSRTRALQGFTPSETATFIFSLKDALLPAIETEAGDNLRLLADETARTNRFIDALGLVTFETYVAGREEYIREQQRSILELSTPVVEVWAGILTLPLVGTVDTARTQQMMESLLNRIVETQASYVIIDITGVPLVDTAVAKHLLQTVTAARLLGAECIIVGISARIAQTLVHLGVDLSDVNTGTSLAKGLTLALKATGLKIVRADEGG